MEKHAIILTLAMLAGQPAAFASCTQEESSKKREIALDRASLVEMQDLSTGRSLHQRILAMELAGMTRGSNVNWNDVCARYDDITKAANDRLARPPQTGPAHFP